MEVLIMVLSQKKSQNNNAMNTLIVCFVFSDSVLLSAFIKAATPPFCTIKHAIFSSLNFPFPIRRIRSCVEFCYFNEKKKKN